MTIVFFLLFLRSLILSTDVNDYQSNIKIEVIEYRNWKESIKIYNKDVIIIVVPSIGRIMFYGANEAENLLWNNPDYLGKTSKDFIDKGIDLEKNWINYGGDKVWLNQQSDFKKYYNRLWPPDIITDGIPFNYKLLKNGIIINSDISKHTGVSLIRTITINETGTKVNIDQTIKMIEQNQSHLSVNSTIWSVTQIEKPILVRTPLQQNSSNIDIYEIKLGDSSCCRIEKNDFIFNSSLSPKSKVNVKSIQWLRAEYDDYFFYQYFDLIDNISYPENGMSTSFYWEENFTELEIYSPLFSLQSGQANSYNIIWEIVPKN